jgi:hypothetical protein
LTKRVTDMRWWRRQRARVDAPPKDHVYAATDELLAERLRGLTTPEPPQALRERNERSYGEWLDSAPGRNRWRE